MHSEDAPFVAAPLPPRMSITTEAKNFFGALRRRRTFTENVWLARVNGPKRPSLETRDLPSRGRSPGCLWSARR